MKYQNFEDWFNEIEGFALRSERAYAEIQPEAPGLVEWLRAAFEAGRETKGYIEP